MIANTLHNISDHLCIKKMKGQAHQFCQKIRDQSDIDPGIHMQHNPAAYKTNR